MSWDFDLCDPVTREVLSTDEKHFMFGGTVCVGGDTSMTLNVTYNYSDIINKVMVLVRKWVGSYNPQSGHPVFMRFANGKY